MEYSIYLICAIVGCTIVALQVVMQVFGFLGEADAVDMDADADVDMDTDTHEGHGNAFFGILSFKALCAFAGIFGLVGLILHGGDSALHTRLLISFGAGVAGMLMVAWMMRGLSRLQASGTIDMRNAVGRTATVYLPIPERNSGRGKVTVEIQGRSMEVHAITEGDSIQTGARVSVVSLEGDETLKVVPL